jgi:biotin-dependent carboxylase-like uncharacterized protein
MAEAVFKIEQVGPLVTYQDSGRFNLMRFGVPASGPMDRQSFAIAQACLSNPPQTSGIEISFGGLTLECVTGKVTCAVVGGGFQVLVNEKQIGAWQIFTLTAGMRLTIKSGHWGNWTYLAFAGQIDIPVWLGSSATIAASNLGAGQLVKDAEMRIRGARVAKALEGPVPCPVSARPRDRIKVVLGPQDRFFSKDMIATFLSEPFALTTAYDRMGVRLAGPVLRPEAALEIPSEAIARGSVQISGDGVPTVLLADHQATGGYPKIATVLSGDLDGLVQMKMRRNIGFEAIAPSEAVRITRLRHGLQDRFLERLRSRNSQG